MHRLLFLFAMFSMGNSEANNTAQPRKDYVAWILIFACAALAYFPALNGGFLWLDDFWSV